MDCSHRHCDGQISRDNAMWKGDQPFHTYCFYAHPDYDVKLREGSPFTTITLH